MASKITTLFEDSAKENALYPRTKQSAVSDADGNPLTEVGFYTSETVGNGVDNVKVAFDMDLLWTNPSPTSVFSAQTVSLDLSDYNAVVVSFFRTNDYATTPTFTGITPKGIESVGYASEPGVANIYSRKYTATDNGVTFSTGYATGSTTTSNADAIPHQIYGIR